MLSRPFLPELLMDAEPFKGMTLEEVATIVARGRVISVAENRAVFEQGFEADNFYMLTEGCVRVVKTQPDGQQVILRYFPAGQLIGIAQAMNLPVYPATAVAVTDCAVLMWPSHLWASFSQSYPAFAANAMNTVGRRLQETQARLIEISTQRAEQRIALALLHIGDSIGKKDGEGFTIDIPLSRQDVAEMTATTLHTVSRLLASWEREGLVRLGRQKVDVLSRKALARHAVLDEE
jgi:CRP-like cAMP-binding protein